MEYILNPNANEENMRESGFTDYIKEKWYLCKRVFDHTTLNITIVKNTGDVEVDVLDEFILQPIQFDLLVPDIKEDMTKSINLIINDLCNAGILIKKVTTGA